MYWCAIILYVSINSEDEKIEASHSPILINLSYLALVPVATSTESEDREVRSFTQSHTNLSYF